MKQAKLNPTIGEIAQVAMHDAIGDPQKAWDAIYYQVRDRGGEKCREAVKVLCAANDNNQ